MKALLSSLLMVMLLTTLSAADVAQATEYSRRLGNSGELPGNIQLRFQVLAARLDDIKRGENFNDVLRFFSDTRVMVWNRPVSQAVEQTMVNLEQQMVQVAQKKGLALDLPPVGYSPRGGATGSRLFGSDGITANGLSIIILHAERLSTEVLATQNSAELLFLRDNMTRLREDMADGAVSSDRVRSVLGGRARFLASASAQSADPRLLEQLIIVGEVLRTKFSVDTLRSRRGQDLKV